MGQFLLPLKLLKLINRETKSLMKNFLKILNEVVNHKISIKELYFSLTTWFVLLIGFLGFTTRFQSTLFFINLIIALLVFVVVILFTNRLLLSCFLTLLMAVSFDYIKQIKWQFLLQDFSAADIYMVKLLINHGLLRLMYEYATKEIYLVIILLVLNFILLWNKTDALLDKHKLGSKSYYALRLLSIGVSILIIGKLFETAVNPVSVFTKAINSVHKATKTASQRKFYGPFADVLFTLKDIYIEPIALNTSEQFILRSTNKLDPEITLNELPDIVVILNESTINPYKLDYPFTDSFNFDFFKDNKYTQFNGILDVNTFGGSSWISEYEINTGIPHKLFKGPSYMPFISLAPLTQKSLMSYLRSIGYETIVLYPIDKNFSTAKDAYTMLGADQMYDIHDFGYKPTSWAKVPDKIIGDIIVKLLDDRNTKPKYIFAATMLNHGPHSSFFDDNLGCMQFMHDSLCSKLNDYILRIGQTNKDQLALIEKLMNRKTKTVLVNYGDHMPSFEGYATQLRFTKDINDFYKTFYNININFQIGKQVRYPLLDITFMPGLVLDIAGINNDEFYKANSYIRKICHGNLKNCSSTDVKLLESYKSLAIKQLGF